MYLNRNEKCQLDNQVRIHKSDQVTGILSDEPEIIHKYLDTY